MGAEGNVARSFLCVQPEDGLEPLAFGVYEGDGSNRRTADERRQAGDVVVGVFGGGVKDVKITQGIKPGVFVSGEWSNYDWDLWCLPRFPVDGGREPSAFRMFGSSGTKAVSLFFMSTG